MIRKLTVDDAASAHSLLSQHRFHNLYLLSNMQQLGFESEICDFWGDFADDGGTLRGVLNRYMSGWSIYGMTDADWRGLASILNTHHIPATRLQDNPGGIDTFLPYLRRYQCERASEEELMILSRSDFVPVAVRNSYIIRRAQLSDLDELVVHYASAGSMMRSPSAIERPLRDLRIWIAEKDGQILSSALTNAELDDAAMIGGVYTQPELRGQGLGRSVCSALCAELLQEEKQPTLYWKTPAAGFVYRTLGFRTIGIWRSVWLRQTEV